MCVFRTTAILLDQFAPKCLPIATLISQIFRTSTPQTASERTIRQATPCHHSMARLRGLPVWVSHSLISHPRKRALYFGTFFKHRQTPPSLSQIGRPSLGTSRPCMLPQRQYNWWVHFGIAHDTQNGTRSTNSPNGRATY
jgi:hypothetical protein